YADNEFSAKALRSFKWQCKTFSRREKNLWKNDFNLFHPFPKTTLYEGRSGCAMIAGYANNEFSAKAFQSFKWQCKNFSRRDKNSWKNDFNLVHPFPKMTLYECRSGCAMIAGYGDNEFSAKALQSFKWQCKTFSRGEKNSWKNDFNSVHPFPKMTLYEGQSGCS
ncbi:hypothetical protein KI387_002602, partial [Taxus chinensis]